MTAPRGIRPPRGDITARQLEALRIIDRLINERGFPPTFKELAGELGVVSTQAVYEFLARLIARGLLLRHARTPRAMTLTPAGRELLARLPIERTETS